MMKKSLGALPVLAALVALGIGAGSVTAHATTTINFDDGTARTSVGSTYSGLGVTFSGASFTDNFGLSGSSGGLGIYSTSHGFQFGGDTPIVGQFSSAVSSITIRGIDPGQAGIRIDAYDALNAFITSDSFFGSNVGVGAFHDLSVTAAGIASFRVYQPLTTAGGNAYGDGVLFDNLSFDAATPVPEPASWVLMLAGIAGAGAAMRRRRQDGAA